MTYLAITADHVVEYEQSHRLLTITRYGDGCCKALTGPKIAQDFRDCLKTHSPERVIETYLKIAASKKCDWEPLYKPGLTRAWHTEQARAEAAPRLRHTTSTNSTPNQRRLEI